MFMFGSQKAKGRCHEIFRLICFVFNHAKTCSPHLFTKCPNVVNDLAYFSQTNRTLGGRQPPYIWVSDSQAVKMSLKSRFSYNGCGLESLFCLTVDESDGSTSCRRKNYQTSFASPSPAIQNHQGYREQNEFLCPNRDVNGGDTLIKN